MAQLSARPVQAPAVPPVADCPRCATVVPGGQLDRDLLVCPACRDLLRLEMASWLMHLVGLGTLPPFAGPVREVPLPTQPHRVEAW